MSWYAIRTAPNLENRARHVLAEAGHEVFLPTQIKIIRADRNGYRRSITAPLIPGYLFVRQVPWSLMRDAQFCGRRLLLGVLGMSGPEPIPDESVAAIRTIDGGDTPIKCIRPGDEITVRVGRFDRRRVVVSDVTHGKIQVAMLILGASRLVTIAPEQVEAA